MATIDVHFAIGGLGKLRKLDPTAEIGAGLSGVTLGSLDEMIEMTRAFTMNCFESNDPQSFAEFQRMDIYQPEQCQDWTQVFQAVYGESKNLYIGHVLNAFLVYYALHSAEGKDMNTPLCTLTPNEIGHWLQLCEEMERGFLSILLNILYPSWNAALEPYLTPRNAAKEMNYTYQQPQKTSESEVLLNGKLFGRFQKMLSYLQPQIQSLHGIPIPACFELSLTTPDKLRAALFCPLLEINDFEPFHQLCKYVWDQVAKGTIKYAVHRLWALTYFHCLEISHKIRERFRKAVISLSEALTLSHGQGDVMWPLPNTSIGQLANNGSGGIDVTRFPILYEPEAITEMDNKGMVTGYPLFPRRLDGRVSSVDNEYTEVSSDLTTSAANVEDQIEQFDTTLFPIPLINFESNMEERQHQSGASEPYDALDLNLDPADAAGSPIDSEMCSGSTIFDDSPSSGMSSAGTRFVDPTASDSLVERQAIDVDNVLTVNRLFTETQSISKNELKDVYWDRRTKKCRFPSCSSDRTFVTSSNWFRHFRCKHQSRQQSSDSWCEICKTSYCRPDALLTHLGSKIHLKNAQKQV